MNIPHSRLTKMAKTNNTPLNTLFLNAFQLCNGCKVYNPHTGHELSKGGQRYIDIVTEATVELAKCGNKYPPINYELLAKSGYWFPNKPTTDDKVEVSSTSELASKSKIATQENKKSRTKKTDQIKPEVPKIEVVPVVVTDEERALLERWKESKQSINPHTKRVLTPGGTKHQDISIEMGLIEMKLSQLAKLSGL